MEKFLEQLFGNVDFPTYAAWFVLAFIGAFAGVLVRAKLKYKNDSDTPKKWDWGFLWQDNSLTLVIGFIITFIFIRFSKEMLNLEPTAFGALIIGATNNELATLFISFKARK
jgi:fluoride ion exporter CrcB/FEX